MATAPQNTQDARKAIPTQVKDSALVEEKRRRIVEAAVSLFIRKGFHQTTTREIAKAAGFAIGTLYEYIASKEDVLYLVCEAIHQEMERRLREEISQKKTPRETLESAIAAYIRACDQMQDSILLIYRETASLDEEAGAYVLQNEERITLVFQSILEEGAKAGAFHFAHPKAVSLMAHNIVVLGHMWAFRRWFLRERFTVDEYVQYQTSLITGEIVQDNAANPVAE